MEFLFSSEQIVWQEAPGEVSLAYVVSGCPLRCRGCHSADTWAPDVGRPLTQDYVSQRLRQYRGLVTCVIFFGGEWREELLLSLLRLIREQGLNTCLYTGRQDVTPNLRAQLTYLKTGPWIEELGGLDSPRTNQRFVDLRTGALLNHKFIKSLNQPPLQRSISCCA